MELGKNILLVDDHLVVRKGVEMILNANIQNATVFNVEDYDQAKKFLETINVDLILLDININGTENIKIMKELKAIQSQVKILIFSSHEESQYGLRYIQNGADGYLNKFCSEDLILNAINEILLKGVFYSNEIKDKLFENAKKRSSKTSIESLSNREFEIAQLLINGYGNLEISNKLNIQMSTVSTYKNRLFDKLNINNVVALAELFKTENQ